MTKYVNVGKFIKNSARVCSKLYIFIKIMDAHETVKAVKFTAWIHYSSNWDYSISDYPNIFTEFLTIKNFSICDWQSSEGIFISFWSYNSKISQTQTSMVLQIHWTPKSIVLIRAPRRRRLSTTIVPRSNQNPISLPSRTSQMSPDCGLGWYDKADSFN